MKVKLGNGLILQSLLVVLLNIIIFFIPSVAIKLILGLPFLLFSPGYTLILALFPQKDRISTTERITLSFGLSVVIVSLIGLILNFTPLGITLEPTLYSLTGFVLLASLIAWLRLTKLDKAERFNVELDLKLSFPVKGAWSKTASLVLMFLILAALGVLVYMLTMREDSERYTEFYIVGPGGAAAGYPTEISAGNTASVILGICNHESEASDYLIKIRIGELVYKELCPVNLKDDEGWEDTVTFALDNAGENQKVEFLLFKGDNPEVYRSLYLWFDVID